MGAEAKTMQTAWVFLPLLFSLFVMTGCSGTLMPYESSFQCPGGYNGICESIDDAYHDSVNGIDPRQFDEEWQEKKADWAESHSKLVEARKKIGKETNTLSRPGDTALKPSSYRESYFRKLKGLIDAPETPVLVPPKVIRILVLPRTYERNRSLVGSHYLFSQLEDGPRWILRKVPEIPEPCLGEEQDGSSGADAGLNKLPETKDDPKRSTSNTGIENGKASSNCPSLFNDENEDEELEWVP